MQSQIRKQKSIISVQKKQIIALEQKIESYKVEKRSNQRSRSPRNVQVMEELEAERSRN